MLWKIKSRHFTNTKFNYFISKLRPYPLIYKLTHSSITSTISYLFVSFNVKSKDLFSMLWLLQKILKDIFRLTNQSEQIKFFYCRSQSECSYLCTAFSFQAQNSECQTGKKENLFPYSEGVISDQLISVFVKGKLSGSLRFSG